MPVSHNTVSYFLHAIEFHAKAGEWRLVDKHEKELIFAGVMIEQELFCPLPIADAERFFIFPFQFDAHGGELAYLADQMCVVFSDS